MGVSAENEAHLRTEGEAEVPWKAVDFLARKVAILGMGHTAVAILSCKHTTSEATPAAGIYFEAHLSDAAMRKLAKPETLGAFRG